MFCCFIHILLACEFVEVLVRERKNEVGKGLEG